MAKGNRMSVSVANVGALTDFKAAHASVGQIRLYGPPQVDRTTEISYDEGAFKIQVVGFPGPIGRDRDLTEDEKRALLSSLQEELESPPTGLDVLAARAFVDLLSRDLSRQTSTRFDNVRFGDIARDPTGTILWHVGIPVDLEGTIRDRHGRVTFEQHVVPLPPGPYLALSRADRLSLASAVEKFISQANAQKRPINILWEQVLNDLKR
jgi:hypothetical protein